MVAPEARFGPSEHTPNFTFPPAQTARSTTWGVAVARPGSKRGLYEGASPVNMRRLARRKARFQKMHGFGIPPAEHVGRKRTLPGANLAHVERRSRRDPPEACGESAG